MSRVARPRKADFQPVVERLRRHFSDTEIATLLGIFRWKLDWREIDLPTARLAWLILQLIEKPGQSVILLDLLTLGKYALKAPVKPASSPEYEI